MASIISATVLYFFFPVSTLSIACRAWPSVWPTDKRAAKVSRITVYRRFDTKDTLIEHVVRREFRRYFDRFLIDIEQAGTAAAASAIEPTRVWTIPSS